MESYSTQAVLSAVDRGFTSQMKAAADSLDEIDEESQKAAISIMDIAKGVGAFKVISIAVDTLKNSIGAAVDRFDTLNQYPKVMQNLGYTIEDADASLEKLSSGIQGVPTALDSAATYTKQWALATGDLETATDLYLAINDGAIAYGASAGQAASVQEQLNQMISAGTYDLQSWKIIQQNCPGMLDAVAQAILGESAAAGDLRDALNAGNVTTEEFENTLISLDQNGSSSVTAFSEAAKTASGGIATSATNMQTAVVRGMESLIRSTNDALTNNGLPDFQEMIENATSGIDKAFAVASKGAGIAVQAVNALTPVFAAVLAGYLAFETVAGAQKAWSSIQKGGAEAGQILNAVINKERLAAEASAAKETAVKAAAKARQLDNVASAASARAIEAETIARESAIAVTKTKTAAEAALRAETKVRTAEEKLSAAALKLKTAEEKAAAAATKSKSVQEKAALAVTKAKANVDKQAAALEAAKANAERAGAASSELSAKAEIMDMAATKAASTADEKAVTASMAKATADRVGAKAAELEAEAEAKKTLAEEAGNIAAANGSLLAVTKAAALGVLSGSLKITEAAQMSLNAAMAANPIGTVIVMITALTAVTVGVAKALSKLDTRTQELQETQQEAVESAKELAEELDSSSKAYEDNASDIQASSKASRKLAEDITKLASKEEKSAQDKAELKAYVDSLNSSMEGLNLRYDEEKDALSMSADALMEKVEAYNAAEQASSAQERLLEVQKEQVKIDLEQQELAEKRNQYEKEWQALNDTGPASMGRYNKALQEMNEQEEALNQKKQELEQSEEELKNIMVESQTAQAEAVNAGTESQIISLGDLNETQQSVVESMGNAWQSYAEQATNMFDTLSDKSELSVSEMTANLQENQRIIGEWADNIEALAQRGVDEGLLEQLRQAGPESAGYVNAMVQASDTELQALSDAFAQGGETATTAFKTAFQLNDVPQGVMDMVTQTEQTLREQIEAADFASIGKYIPEGLNEGISEGASQAAEASTAMAEDVNTAAANTMGIHSPSTVFMEYGQNLVEGLVIGIQGSSERINATMEASMSSAGKTAVSAMNKSMSGLEKINSSAFSKINVAAKSGMSQMTAAITSGTVKNNTAMQSGMRVMNTSVQTGARTMNTSIQSGMRAMNVSEQAGLRTMKATMASGMTAIKQEVDSGMNQANASIIRGSTAMNASLTSLRSGFYNSGYYASVGLAQGINAGASVAISAAQRLADRVALTMRDALKVHSPSRVTMQIGEYAGVGAAIGLMNAVPDVEQASLKVSKAMEPGTIADYVDSISMYGSANNFALRVERGDRGANYDYLIGGLRDAIANLNIQVQAIISARDIGNASTKYVDRKIGSRTAMKERYGCV